MSKPDSWLFFSIGFVLGLHGGFRNMLDLVLAISRNSECSKCLCVACVDGTREEEEEQGRATRRKPVTLGSLLEASRFLVESLPLPSLSSSFTAHTALPTLFFLKPFRGVISSIV